jgi:hypothetical protein
MRTIERTGQFKRDFRRALKGPNRETLEEKLAAEVCEVAGIGRRKFFAHLAKMRRG